MVPLRVYLLHKLLGAKSYSNGFLITLQRPVIAHIKVLSDNQTAVAYIQIMGGTPSPSCNQTRDILLWCKQRKLKVTHHLNVVADKASRDVEWAIDHCLIC